MPGDHPLTQAVVVHAVERTASQHSGRPWRVEGFVDLNERASHPCGIFHGETFSVFAKLDAGVTSEQFEAELRGLRLLGRQPGVTTPTPVGERPVITEAGSLLLLEALPEIPAQERSAEQWRSLGRVLGVASGARGNLRAGGV